MGERTRDLREELRRIYENNNNKKPETPTVTIKGIIKPAKISQIRKQIEKN